MAKTERFEKVYGQGVFTGNEIWVDTETGVQYLYHAAGNSGGLTLLVDADGKPLLYRKTRTHRNSEQKRKHPAGCFLFCFAL